VANSIGPLPHNRLKTTEKQQATALTASEFAEKKQELKDTNAGREEMKMEGTSKTSSVNKIKQIFASKQTAASPAASPQSCAERCTTNGKMAEVFKMAA
jgi:hypothetical protein